ncbi:2-hydroxy-3-oxopropionate reductase [Bermanella sp. 47_1433_sub80_T6]|nr:2-hydroxy-3-oxopropionate reductase [Bermanella sp. 47_1433_sub80_T6]
MPKIGFIGIGLMGLPMCRRLLDAGFEVGVWNRNPDKCQPLISLGAQHFSGLQQLAESVDVIMLCVSNTDSVMQISDNLFPHLLPGQTIIDFSSISPDATRQLSEKAAQKAVNWLDSPVSGGVAGAQAGTLAIMIGGDEAQVDKVRPLLAPLASSVTYMGPSGTGQTTKICNQMLVSCNVLVMAEVMAMAQRSGVDASRIPQALKGGFADSIPLQLTGTRMAQQDFSEVKWHVKTLLKDLDMANTLAKQTGSATPMAGLGAQLMRQHASKGYSEQDPATLVTLYQADKQKKE